MLAVLPGSRKSEVTLLMPPFGETVAIVAKEIDGLHILAPLAASVDDLARREMNSWPVPVVYVPVEENMMPLRRRMLRLPRLEL